MLLGDDGVIGAEMLYGAIHAACAAQGLACRGPVEIEPHMTLLRNVEAEARAVIEPLGWWVRDFALVRSFQGNGRQQIVARFPLDG